MKVKLYSVFEEAQEFDIGKVEDIYLASIEIVSGDEILEVLYHDGQKKRFDSLDWGKHARLEDIDEGRYDVYIPGVLNLFGNPEWLARKAPYDNYQSRW